MDNDDFEIILSGKVEGKKEQPEEKKEQKPKAEQIKSTKEKDEFEVTSLVDAAVVAKEAEEKAAKAKLQQEEEHKKQQEQKAHEEEEAKRRQAEEAAKDLQKQKEEEIKQQKKQPIKKVVACEESMFESVAMPQKEVIDPSTIPKALENNVLIFNGTQSFPIYDITNKRWDIGDFSQSTDQAQFVPIDSNLIQYSTLKGKFLVSTGGRSNGKILTQACKYSIQLADSSERRGEFLEAGANYQLTDLPVPKYLHQGVIMTRDEMKGDKKKQVQTLYVIGGKSSVSEEQASNKMLRIEVSKKKNQWEEVASMNTPRCCFAAIAIKSSIYVFGGFTGGMKEAKLVTLPIEQYETSSNQWTTISIQMPVLGAFAWALGKFNELFILGGSDGQDMSSTLWKIDYLEKKYPKAKIEADPKAREKAEAQLQAYEEKIGWVESQFPGAKKHKKAFPFPTALGGLALDYDSRQNLQGFHQFGGLGSEGYGYYLDVSDTKENEEWNGHESSVFLYEQGYDLESELLFQPRIQLTKE